MPLDQVDIDRLDLQTNREKEMSFIEHLEEFRWVMIRSIIGIILMTIMVFIFKDFFIDDLIFGPAKGDFVGYQFLCNISQIVGSDVMCFSNDIPLQSLRMSEQFMSHFQISIILGFVLAFPWVFWQIWLFVSPALNATETGAMRGVTFFSWFFFMLGILFGYFFILPLSINFFYNYQISDTVENIYKLSEYVGNITMITVGTGVMFELPMVIFLLSKMGIVGPNQLRAYRKIAFVAILIIGAVITPADIASMFLVAIPVYALYELSIFISAWVHNQNNKKNATT